jgi:hypothetical protein
MSWVSSRIAVKQRRGELQLTSRSSIDWIIEKDIDGVSAGAVYFGEGPQAIQVATATSETKPNRQTLRQLHSDRKGKLLVNVIVAVTCAADTYVFGPDVDSETLVQKNSSAAKYLNSVLSQPNGVLAFQRAISFRRSLQTTDLSGFTNNGLFASHYIKSSISSHSKWQDAQKLSSKLVGLRARNLISALGFDIQESQSRALLLSAQGDETRVVAVLLENEENFESKSARFQATPVEWGISVANQQGAPWVVAVRGGQLRLYPALDGVGVGQRSQVETYFEIDLATIDDENAGLLSLIFSSTALMKDGTAEELLRDSRRYAADLGKRLRERIYESVVPELATEVGSQLQRKGRAMDAPGLQLAYELTLRILFRLLFQAYAEDRGLLPAGRNEIFDSNSLKHWAKHLITRDSSVPFGDSATIWYDLRQVWDAIDQGNPEMQIPAYNGGLFGADPTLNPEGHLIIGLAIPDKVLAPALRALLIDDSTEDGVAGAVDFRSLSVREFGTIYEGLLESSLSLASQDLTVNKKGAWVPAAPGDEVLAKSGQVYFHSASGERKSTGSYYTPSFVVEQLVDQAVTPALEKHLATIKSHIDSGDQVSAYNAFFDFKVVDLAMGSAHFLVSAIDKIESQMRSFVIQPENAIEGLSSELLRLENVAKTALGSDEAAYAEIESSSLLRRQIARRCIYGLDINPLAVELARLAIWIHTFVPGLPMSNLERNLVCADSLSGIGTVQEGLSALRPDLKPGIVALFDFVSPIVDQALSESKRLLEDVARADEANKKEALKVAETARVAKRAAEKARTVFDLSIAVLNGVATIEGAESLEDLEVIHQSNEVQDFIRFINPAHMPYLFPEVFVREVPGFDVVLGNPPWEELVVDEPRFWASKTPGLLSVPIQKRRELIEELKASRPDLVLEIESKKKSAELTRKVLQKRFPLGVGDTDLYKAFGWVAYSLLSANAGQLGYVLPKTAFSAAGMELWRRKLHASGTFNSITYMQNKGQWIFQIDPRYKVAMFTYAKGSYGGTALRGPILGLDEFEQMALVAPVLLDRENILNFTASAAIPEISNQAIADVMKTLRNAPNLSDYENGSLRAVTEFHATNDSKHFEHGAGPVNWPVLSGKSFRIWEPETKEFFAFANPDIALAELNSRLSKQLKLKSSAFYGLSFQRDLGGMHPAYRPRIAFRNVTRSNDSRTFIPALIPPNQLLTNIAPYFLFSVGRERQEAYLLGVTSSLVFDWYTRKFVELALNFHLLNSFPVPSYSETTRSKRIVEIAGLLSAVDERYAGWAAAVGVPVGGVTSASKRESMTAELDGLVAAEYGLSPGELEIVFSTFHVGWSDASRLQKAIEVLKTEIQNER